MFIRRLSVTNFMPFKGQHELSFPHDTVRNVVVVFGDNMRGKTSLLNAIRWAFYGKAVDRYGAVIGINRLVNMDAASAGEWGLEAAVSFEHQGRAYQIVRSANKRKTIAVPLRSEDFEVAAQMTVDDEVVRADQVQHLINQIVPEQISRFFLFDGELLGEYESLLRDDGDQGRRIKVAIEEALGVPALAHGRDELRIVKKPFERQMQQDLKACKGLEHFTAQLTDFQREFELLEGDRIRFQDELQKTRREYQGLVAAIDASEQRYAQRTKLDQSLAERKRIENQLNQLDERKLLATKDAWRDVIRPRLELRRAQVQEEIERTTSAHLQASADDLIPVFRLRASEHGECPVCLQPVPTSLAALPAKERSAKSDVLSGIAAANQIARRLSEFKYGNAKSILSEIESFGTRLAVEQTKLDNLIASLRKELQDFDSDEAKRIRRQAEQCNHACLILEQRLEENAKLMEKNRATRESLRHVINQDKNARGQKSSKIVEMIATLESVFSSAIDKLRDSLRSTVEQRSTQAFRAMTTDKSYLGLRINENYGLTILDQAGREVSLRSAGAEQVVALSLIDGLNQTGRSAGPVLMDTPFGRLDPKHRANILRYLPESAAQVVLFVHEGEIRKDTDLATIAPKIGAVYSLEGISSSQSRIVRDRT